MNTALMYHFWNDYETQIWKSLQFPIILSIASFRYWDRESDIYVVDISGRDLDWGDYPQFLNFSVVPKPYYHLYLFSKNDAINRFRHRHVDHRMLSKPKDMSTHAIQIPQKSVICADVDFFFIKDPRPFELPDDAPIYVGWNSGYWNFNKTSPLARIGFELWSAFCANVCLDFELYQTVLSYCPPMRIRHMIDEIVLRYLAERFPSYYKQPPYYDHVLLSKIGLEDMDLSQIRGLHALHGGFRPSKDRGLVCLYIKELRDQMEVVLGPQRMADIFGQRSLPCFSITDLNGMKYLNNGKQFI